MMILAVDALVCAWAIPLAVTDLRERRLPRALTVPAYPVAATLITLAAVLGHAAQAVAALLGAAGLRAIYALARAASPGGSGLGRGDVTLSAPLGAWLAGHGLDTWLLGSGGGFALSGLAALALLACGRARRGTELPHGPGMLLAAALAVAAWHACPG